MHAKVQCRTPTSISLCDYADNETKGGSVFVFYLPALSYFVGLRSGKSVHPTLRPIAHTLHREIQKVFPKVRLYSDLDADDWDIRRGLQDIQKK